MRDTTSHTLGRKPRIFSRATTGEKAFDVVNVVFLFVVVVATLYPFLNVLAIALNDSVDTVKGGITIFPRKVTLENFSTIFAFPNLTTAFLNSVLRALIGTVAGLLACSMLAYTLSRRDFRARRFVSVFLAVTMYVSGGLIPFFLLIRDLHLMNSFLVYVLPGIVGAFNVFMIRSFMDNLPAELQESAFMDGASDWTVYWKIILPLCKPVLATIALFIAVGQWNAWFDAYLYNGSAPELTVLQFELMKIIQSTMTGNDAVHSGNLVETMRSVSPDSIKMAITIVTIVPILAIYPFLQRYFVSGMTLGAVKA
jgi:putative aldouronate transport system permease protein